MEHGVSNPFLEWTGKSIISRKLPMVLLSLGLLIGLGGFGQTTVTLTERNASIIKVFREIRKQTGFSFMLTRQLLLQARRINVDVKNMELADALTIIFKDMPLTYVIVGKTIVVKGREKGKSG